MRKRNSYPFFQNYAKTKFIFVFQSDAKTKKEIRSSKPFFKVKRKRKTKRKIQTCFSMSCENEKCWWYLNSIFSCHRKTVGTKVQAFTLTEKQIAVFCMNLKSGLIHQSFETPPPLPLMRGLSLHNHPIFIPRWARDTLEIPVFASLTGE